MGGVVESGQEAYEMAGLGPDDIDVAELHDMFTILEFLQMEGLDFADEGEAWKHIEDGRTEKDGELPINTSGGLKSKATHWAHLASLKDTRFTNNSWAKPVHGRSTLIPDWPVTLVVSATV